MGILPTFKLREGNAPYPLTFSADTQLVDRFVTDVSIRDFALRLVMRPDGRVAVLAWNPGPTAPLVIQLPDSGRAERFEVTLAGSAFTTVLLSS